MPAPNSRDTTLKKSSVSPLFFILGSIIVIIAALLYISWQGTASARLHDFAHMLMGTEVTLRLHSDNRREAEQAGQAAFEEMARVEALLSRTVDDSDVERVNRRAGSGPVTVSPETVTVLRAALEYAQLSGGAFDPTVAPLLDLWGFPGGDKRVPEPAEIETLLPLVDFNLVELDEQSGTVFLPAAGISIDLGAIAKGYNVDRGLAVLSAAGVKHAFLNAGGDIGLLGTRPDGSPWRIGIGHPREPGQVIGVLPLSGDIAVVTSGDYERFFEEGGRSYHHILDPSTGYPSRLLAGVTIVAPTAMEADALSTAVFVLGPARGMELVEDLPGVEAVLITPELKVTVSSGLKDIFEPVR